MKDPVSFSVGYSFQPGLIKRLAEMTEVKEVYGCRGYDSIGSGRSAYTLVPVSDRTIGEAVTEAHREGLSFNYLLNAASLYGIEQTRQGNRLIRRTLDRLSALGVDALTLCAPLLLRIVKKQYPHFKVRVGAFTMIDSPAKALRWEEMGADTLCLSAIACNRDFSKLRDIRAAVRCGLQLIVNASCQPSCVWEATHMHLLSQSSMKGHSLKGFCLDYCFLQCSAARIGDPANFLKSIWIRPEDLWMYEELGYRDFKIVERSSPADIVLRRTSAYSNRSFDGNLWELVAPLAWITREQKAPWRIAARLLTFLARPWFAPLSSMLDMKRYASSSIPHDFSRQSCPVYIDNRSLDGFIQGLRDRQCGGKTCASCGYCLDWADRAVTVEKQWRDTTAAMAQTLDAKLISGSLWGL